jgi:hypothetical protein
VHLRFLNVVWSNTESVILPDHLRRLREAVRKKRPQIWGEQSWVLLHHDNVSAHMAPYVHSFSRKETLQPFHSHPTALISPQRTFSSSRNWSSVHGRSIWIRTGKARKKYSTAGNPNFFKSLYEMVQKMEEWLESLCECSSGLFEKEKGLIKCIWYVLCFTY